MIGSGAAARLRPFKRSPQPREQALIAPMPGHTTTGHQWLSANGAFTFIAVESPGAVAVLDNRTGVTVADHPYPNPPGGSRPHGVFYVPGR